jgi:acyl carrier protein
MQDLSRAQELVFHAIDAINAVLPPKERIEKSPSTVLVGEGGCLDSMGFVELAMHLQEAVLDAYGVPISVADESVLDGATSFRTAGSLAEHLARLVESAQCV